MTHTTHGPAGPAALTHTFLPGPRAQGLGRDPDNETFAPKIPLPSWGNSREAGTQKSLFLRAPLSGRPEQAGTDGGPRAGGATRPSPDSQRRPSAGELAAAACPESPLTGLGDGLPSDQTTITWVREDSCSPLPPGLSSMFSEHSSYNLGCFSVLGISPKETCDPGGTWSREEISEKGASEDRRRRGAGGAGAACSLPICLCGKSGNGLKVPGRGSPSGGGGQTSVGNPAGGSSGA